MTQRMQELRASSGVEPSGNLTVHSFADERATGTVALLLAAPSTYMVRVYADICSGGREIRWACPVGDGGGGLGDGGGGGEGGGGDGGGDGGEGEGGGDERAVARSWRQPGRRLLATTSRTARGTGESRTEATATHTSW